MTDMPRLKTVSTSPVLTFALCLWARPSVFTNVVEWFLYYKAHLNLMFCDMSLSLSFLLFHNFMGKMQLAV